MTKGELGRWVNRAERGESLVYAVAGGCRHPPGDVLEAARTLRAKGLIALAQRRERTGEIAYVAQRTWKKDEPA